MDSQPDNVTLAVDVAGVTKVYGTRAALCDVDLVARCGEVHGLLGPNGAGKTTLLRLLLGLTPPDSGRLRLLGRDINAAADVLPPGVAGLVEMPAFYPYLSGRRNLELLARLDLLSRAAARRTVADALERTGLAEHADVAVGGYSAGMRQRLGFAGALLRSPQVLILDEPTSALDPAGAREVRALARTLANGGAAVVWSSHDLAEVEDLCRAVTIINRGRVVFSGAVDELRNRVPAATHALQTSDDRAALAIALRSPGVHVTVAKDDLQVDADAVACDAYMIALGCAGVAVRRFERRQRSLESLFFALTAEGDEGHPAIAPPDDNAFDATEWQRAS